jgi:hypothetical protein
MTANELRIGNWVKRLREPLKVTGSIIESWEKLTSLATVQIGGLEPIPLTPQILEKAGFEKEDDNYYSKENIWIQTDIMRVWLMCAPTEFEINVDLKYVHQLQNFYFALTGEELSIEL